MCKRLRLLVQQLSLYPMYVNRDRGTLTITYVRVQKTCCRRDIFVITPGLDNNIHNSNYRRGGGRLDVSSTLAEGHYGSSCPLLPPPAPVAHASSGPAAVVCREAGDVSVDDDTRATQVGRWVVKT